jgi:hypothetical protein
MRYGRTYFFAIKYEAVNAANEQIQGETAHDAKKPYARINQRLLLGRKQRADKRNRDDNPQQNKRKPY